VGSENPHFLGSPLINWFDLLHGGGPRPSAQPQVLHGKFVVAWYSGFRIWIPFSASNSSLPHLGFWERPIFSTQKRNKVTCANYAAIGTHFHDKRPYSLGDMSKPDARVHHKGFMYHYSKVEIMRYLGITFTKGPRVIAIVAAAPMPVRLQLLLTAFHQFYRLWLRFWI
jgi:hypothetical protein